MRDASMLRHGFRASETPAGVLAPDAGFRSDGCVDRMRARPQRTGAGRAGRQEFAVMVERASGVVPDRTGEGL
ncbi:hypothetical protein GCM10010377_44610 [Streptomyces viridiviolaceus]|nr:hypothetical protein GCM10010377_44610 [Streptomyces viridiviolaceus]